MLENYLGEQYVATTLLKRALNNNKIVQAYLFCNDDINYLMKYAKAFAKEIICDSNKDDQITKAIDDEIYSELKIVRPDGNFIKKEQLIDLQNSVMNKPVLGKKIVYIIENCDKLNASSANSILKFLEEPSDDIIAILLTDNISNVMSTIISRCQIVNLNKVKNDGEFNFFSDNDFSTNEEELNDLIDSGIEFIKDIESKKINYLIHVKKQLWEKYDDSNKILAFFRILIYFYMDVLYLKSGNKVRYFDEKEEELYWVSKLNKEENIMKKIYILEKLKNEINYNVNTKLLFDKLVIELGDM